jgi:hypothetical protein
MESHPSPLARAAFSGIVDYAGLFPPAALGLAEAVAEYERARNASNAWMLGRFVVPAPRLEELADAVGHSTPVCAIVAGAISPETLGGPHDPLHVEALEVALATLRAARDTYDAPIGQLAAMRAKLGLEALATYVEVPRDGRWRESLHGISASLARHRLRAKIRCGGESAAAFPTCEEVAAFVIAMVESNVRFKATAGLHHAFRHRDETSGLTMHGFVNLLAGVLLARAGEFDAVEAAIGEEETDAFAFETEALRWRSYRFDTQAVASARSAAFVGFGSCSVDDPGDDLAALGAIAPVCA